MLAAWQPAVDLRTLEAAGCVFVVTNLPDEISAESGLELYRLRWQIEMKFKALKSVLHLGNPPTRRGELLNVYLTAKLIVALLIEEFVYQAESISPWGYPLATCAAVAADASSA
jgi:IS4 transposase